jgi:hypothetical protein
LKTARCSVATAGTKLTHARLRCRRAGQAKMTG